MLCRFGERLNSQYRCCSTSRTRAALRSLNTWRTQRTPLTLIPNEAQSRQSVNQSRCPMPDLKDRGTREREDGCGGTSAPWFAETLRDTQNVGHAST